MLQTPKKPNILVIMRDDVGWFNIGAYHRGIMSGKTPNLDKLASQGVRSPTTTRRQVHRGTREFHHRRNSHSHRNDYGWPGGAESAFRRRRRPSPPPFKPGIRHRPVRQEPSRRFERISASVHGFDEFFGYLYHSTRCRTVLVFLSDRPAILNGRPAQSRALLGDRHRDATIHAGARSASRRSPTKAHCAH